MCTYIYVYIYIYSSITDPKIWSLIEGTWGIVRGISGVRYSLDIDMQYGPWIIDVDVSKP